MKTKLLRLKLLLVIVIVFSTGKTFAQKFACEGAIVSIPFLSQKSVNPVKPKSVNPVKPKDGSPGVADPNSLSATQITLLQKAAASIKQKPECKIRVSGHGEDSKIEQQRSWDKVNAVIKYLFEKAGISRQRFIFEFGTAGDADSVDISYTAEDGPSAVPAPHPDMRGM